ncbi:MAG TPA: LacI family DNA-binding transcriptional regulator [Rhizomicrobium sp.]|nr:LacI family DNA-binding transcriptional regulator [Rhizomicrobium sp.]
MDHKKPASIYDVARSAGVSIKTVSRVINRQPNVSESARTRVLAAVKALSYRPNFYARGLASERSLLIGLVYDNPSASYMSAIQIGALERCREEGYHLIVEQLSVDDPGLGEAVSALVRQSSLHGLILIPPIGDVPAVLQTLKRENVPFVRVAPDTHLQDSPSVSINDELAAHDMTAYLIGLGHRRIAFIKGHPDHGAAYARFEGYRKALREAGIPYCEELVAQGYFSYQSGMEAGLHLLSLKNRPTAIFASNDDMAAAVLAASQRYNLKLPQQLSVAGFDDSLVAQVVWPPLTTCRQPIKEMAAAAVSMLTQIPADDTPLERHLDHELVVRQSTAPPSEN